MKHTENSNIYISVAPSVRPELRKKAQNVIDWVRHYCSAASAFEETGSNGVRGEVTCLQFDFELESPNTPLGATQIALSYILQDIFKEDFVGVYYGKNEDGTTWLHGEVQIEPSLKPSNQ